MGKPPSARCRFGFRPDLSGIEVSAGSAKAVAGFVIGRACQPRSRRRGPISGDDGFARYHTASTMMLAAKEKNPLPGVGRPRRLPTPRWPVPTPGGMGGWNTQGVGRRWKTVGRRWKAVGRALEGSWPWSSYKVSALMGWRSD